MIRIYVRRTIKKTLKVSEKLEENEEFRIETFERCREVNEERKVRRGY
jgi:hypothetical protein